MSSGSPALLQLEAKILSVLPGFLKVNKSQEHRPWFHPWLHFCFKSLVKIISLKQRLVSFSLPAENCLPECFARPQVTLEKFEFNFSLGVLCKRGPFSVLTSSQLMLNCSLFSNSYSSAISQDLGSQSNGGDYASCTGFCNKSEQIFNQQKETSASAVYYILKETSKYLRIT